MCARVRLPNDWSEIKIQLSFDDLFAAPQSAAVLATEAELKALLRPFPADRMKLWPVGRDVGNWRNDGTQLVEPISLD